MGPHETQITHRYHHHRHRRRHRHHHHHHHRLIIIIITIIFPSSSSSALSSSAAALTSGSFVEIQLYVWVYHPLPLYLLLGNCCQNWPSPPPPPPPPPPHTHTHTHTHTHKGQWRGAMMFSLICAGINGWVYNGEAGDLRRRLTHYEVTVMKFALQTVVV